MHREYPDPREFGQHLVDEANARGGEDNITAVVVDVNPGRRRASRDRVGLHTRIELMADVFLFRELDQQELMRAMRIAHQVEVPAGHTIIHEGDHGDAFYIVMEGTATVFKGDKPLTKIHKGTHFGELALIDDHVRSADVVAETDMLLLTFSRTDLIALLRDDPIMGNKLLMSFLRNMSRRVRSLSDSVRELSDNIFRPPP